MNRLYDTILCNHRKNMRKFVIFSKKVLDFFDIWCYNVRARVWAKCGLAERTAMMQEIAQK